MNHLTPLFALALLAPLPEAGAFELLSLVAERDEEAYLLRIEASFEATPAQLLAELTDYDRIYELHPRMTESRSLGQVAAHTEEVYTRFEGCVLFFCRTVHRLEHIRRTDSTLVAMDVPGRGSFSEGHTHWRLQPDGAGTRLSYEARFVPAFRVAPLLGPALLARSVERMTIETMAAADRRAVQRHE